MSKNISLFPIIFSFLLAIVNSYEFNVKQLSDGAQANPTVDSTSTDFNPNETFFTISSENSTDSLVTSAKLQLGDNMLCVYSERPTITTKWDVAIKKADLISSHSDEVWQTLPNCNDKCNYRH